LNTATGEYNIQSFIPIYTTMGVIGEGSPSGTWDTELAMTNFGGNVHAWTITGMFDGAMKMRGDSSWDLAFGADGTQDFPIDTAVLDNSAGNIIVPAGEYRLEFNDTSGIYEFKDPIADYATIGVIGSAVGGWDDDIDMFKNPDPAAPNEWLLTITVVDGELKFRADNDWIDVWGGETTPGGFPTGNAVMPGENITVFAGTWTIAFNSTTGDYSFTPASIGSIGPASPSAGWDDDTDFVQDATVVGLWTTTQDLTAGEFKFRKDDDWITNWGGVDFPMGAASQDGDNINIDMAGTYFISLQTTNPFAGEDEYNGDYSFSIENSTTNPFNVNDVKVIPNPATDLVNVTIEGTELQGDAQVMIFDMTGKLMQTGTYESANNISFNVTNYPTGFYVIQMRGEGFLVSKRFAVAR
ncbi:MAG: T9SS type A sorting domain-containing protein, partial [Saprospiraceae bacterium]